MKRIGMTVVAAFVALTLAGCGGTDDYPETEVASVRLVASWRITDHLQTYEVRSDAAWQDVWATHEPQSIPPTPRPNFDFSRQMILGVTNGSGPNGCHGLNIQRIIERRDDLLVEYQVRNDSSPLILCTQSIVSLSDFVVVPRSNKMITFRRADT